MASAATPRYLKASATNITGSSYPALSCQTSSPSGDGVFSFGILSSLGHNLAILPFGVGANDSTFSLRVVAWNSLQSGLWVPHILLEADVILSTFTGLSGFAQLDNTQRFADTISLTLGNSNVTSEFVSPENNTPAHITLSIKGASEIQLMFRMITATSGNALYKIF